MWSAMVAAAQPAMIAALASNSAARAAGLAKPCCDSGFDLMSAQPRYASALVPISVVTRQPRCRTALVVNPYSSVLPVSLDHRVMRPGGGHSPSRSPAQAEIDANSINYPLAAVVCQYDESKVAHFRRQLATGGHCRARPPVQS